MKLSLAVLGALAVIAGCAASKRAVTTGDIRSGRKTYTEKCGTCHDLVDPASYSDMEWKVHVKQHGRKLRLSGEEKKNLIEYLIGNN